MEQISYPLGPRKKGEKVAILQEGLRIFLENEFFELGEVERQKVKKLLEAENAQKLFGKATAQLVKLFQEKQRLEPTGAVNEATARSMNNLLKELGPEKVTSLNKTELLNLEKLSALSPRNLRQRNAKLYSRIKAIAIEKIRTTLEATFREEPTAWQPILGSVDLASALDQEQDIPLLLLDLLEASDLSDEEKNAVRNILQRLRQSEFRINPLETDSPLHAQAFLQPELQRLKMYHIGDLAKFSDAKVNALLSKIPSPLSVTDERLNILVSDNTLSDTEAQEIGLTANLFQLVDENISLTGALKKERFRKLNPRPIATLQDLAALDADDWVGVVRKVASSLPEGMTSEAYAEILAKRVAALYPTDAFLGRLKILPRPVLISHLETLRPLFGRNESIFTKKDVSELNVDGIRASEVKKIQVAYGELKRFSQAYPGLRIGEILDDSQRSAATKERQIQERLALLTKFHAQNPDKEFLYLDYSPDSAELSTLDFSGFSDDGQHMVLTTLKAYQRTFFLTQNVDQARSMLEAGYQSAMGIASDDVETFIACTGFERTTATRHYEAAQRKVETVATRVGTVLDHQTGWRYVNASNLNPAIDDYLKKFDGYAELFGNQNYCDCQHCQSLLGPAAYFVDLMYFVDRHVRWPIFRKGKRQGHPLDLKVRRPGLWTEELTCENTNTLVPTVDLINEILETYIAQDLAKQQGIVINGQDDPATVEAWVSKVYKKLGETVGSFNQPFLLPLEKLQIYLEHFNRTRAEVARLLGKDSGVVTRAALKISPKEHKLITTKNTNFLFLKNLYGGVPFPEREGDQLNKFDVQLLLKDMGLSRKELGELIETQFIPAGLDEAISIKPGKWPIDSVQNNIEWIKGLSLGSLDRMHRFTRLWRKVPWSIGELDLVLVHLKNADLETVDDIVTALQLQEKLGVSVEVLIALWSNLPEVPVNGGADSLLDRLFNCTPAQSKPPLHGEPPVNFCHPSFSLPNPQADPANALYRLRGGLNVNDEELYQLITYLENPLQLNLNATNPEEKTFPLSVLNLTLLFRHAILAKRLTLSISDFFRLIQFSGVEGGYIDGLSDLTRFLEFYDWWKTAGYSLDDLAFITGGKVEHLSVPQDPGALLGEILKQIRTEKALEFGDTVFAFLEGVTDAQSKAIILANSNVITKTGPEKTTYRLTEAFNAATQLTLPTLKRMIEGVEHEIPIEIKEGGVKLEPEAAQKVLNAFLHKYHPQEVFPAYLSAKLGLSVEKTIALLSMVDADLYAINFMSTLPENRIAWETLRRWKVLRNWVEEVLRLSVFFRKDIFDAPALDFIRAQRAIFSIQDFTRMDFPKIRTLSLYTSMVNTKEEGKFSTKEPCFSPEDVQDVLLKLYDRNSPDQTMLTRVLQVEGGLARNLFETIPLPASAPEALDKLIRCAELAKYLGVDGTTLNLIVAEGADYYERLIKASEALLGAFRAKYSEEQEWKEKSDPFEDRIRGRKRDALTDYLLHSGYPQFETLNDLYHYFLIDVELTGCARTSRVVAAISSVQLYVHRILMNLEQDQAGTLRLSLREEAISEWAWRKNYRVWEANRKIFLYPENYLEPELRDNKTPLFEELEATLLQQEINEQTVLDAYATYMTQFEEVARLKIAGAYHDINPDPADKEDTLHLFGVTPGDPPTYYYRTVNYLYWSEKYPENRGIVWNPWRKIDVQIPVRKVSPIVFQNRLYVFWVEITTLPQNKVEEGSSTFSGYKHSLLLKYTTLRLDGSWAPTQDIALTDKPTFPNPGIISDPIDPQILDPLSWLETHPTYGIISDKPISMAVPKYYLEEVSVDTQEHYEPQEGYSLRGFLWEQVYPEVIDDTTLILVLPGLRSQKKVDFYKKTLTSPEKVVREQWNKLYFSTQERDAVRLFFQVSEEFQFDLGEYVGRTALLEQQQLENAIRLAPNIWNSLKSAKRGPVGVCLSQLNPSDSLAIVNGSLTDCIIDSQGDLLLLQGSARSIVHPLLRRLGSTLAQTLGRTLFSGGLDALLTTDFQKQHLKEDQPPIHINLNDKIVEDEKTRKGHEENVDFEGPYGVYYREIFFHIPFLIANHLNSQGRFSAAQQWYHFLFDPTASEKITPPKDPKDRIWRYLEFRDLGFPKLLEILKDGQALEAYKKDPFNPHAIARSRLSAYQKCIVMKYIDNLLDWADSLFSAFTMESVNEATLLYILVADILGKRPAELGECGEGTLTHKTYENIFPLMKGDSSFLIEMESLNVSTNVDRKRKRTQKYVVDSDSIFTAMKPWDGGRTRSQVPRTGNGALQSHKHFKGNDWKSTFTSSWSSNVSSFPAISYDQPAMSEMSGALTDKGGATSEMKDYSSSGPNARGYIQGFGHSLLRQMNPVFCVPHNKELMEYWDRVEDRLFNIRHCMDIKGVRRQLALFAPEIDPRLLVRAKALGLSLEDVLDSLSGDLPPYRFTYLLEKAKQYAATAQNFGSVLLSALEKKDIEELNRLRTIHEQHIQRLTTQMKQWEINAEEENIQALIRQQETIQARRDTYQKWIDEGLSPWEDTQQVSLHTASIIQGGFGAWAMATGLFYLIPQVGSLFAMTYGGKEKGDSAKAFLKGLEGTATTSDTVSRSAGLEAGFDRRGKEWKLQVALADHELHEIEKRLAAAEIRKQIAEKSLDLHKKAIQQTEEIFDFYGEKFSNFGLYRWISTQLHRLYRDAYNGAYAMTRLAEQAFRFERGESDALPFGGNYWDASNAGLLAGERLLIDLQNLERRFIETNYRTLEIDQSFSVAQINPASLLQLREEGSCIFDIPEICFNLFYPGHYRRKIKAVRITIPCVTGPYTNVSATLTLTNSQVRFNPKADDELKNIPLQRSIAIATSKAQNDSGVFELNFRDERYMPFEGAGAISSWQLSLPKLLRQFDYQTISDVILHISYTSEESAEFKKIVENQIEENLRIIASTKGKGLYRLVSLRHEFPNAFHRLMNPKGNTQTTEFELTKSHFPYFLKDQDLKLENGTAYLNPKETNPVNTEGLKFKLSGKTIGETDSKWKGAYGNLKGGTVSLSGDPIKTWTIAIEAGQLDKEELDDILILLRYKL